MDKLKTKILLISLMLIMLLSLQGAAAASDDGNLTSENIDLSICDNEGNLGSDSILTAANSEDLLGEVDGSFVELQNLIDAHYNSELTLNKSYIYNNDREITITGPITIYGNGNTLNANNGCFIFMIRGDNVVLRDIVFTNGNATDGAAIIWYGNNGTLTNCSFTNNHANDNGGAVYWKGESGNLTNCNFTNNTAKYGGAVLWGDLFWSYGGNGNLINCNFIGNKATMDGGAVYWSGESGYLANCNFTGNNATQGGGAISWNEKNSKLTNCNFKANNATHGGAIHLDYYAKSFNLINCNFTSNKAILDGGAVKWSSENGKLTSCNFIGNNATMFGGAIYWDLDGKNGNLTNCNFTGNTVMWGGAVYWSGESGYLANCNFTGNNATQGGGAIYWNSKNGNVISSVFLNNKANSTNLTVNDENVSLTLTFQGKEYYMNAIYVYKNNPTLTEVTYWNGEIVTGSSPIPSYYEAGQNIIIEVYDSAGTLVDNVTMVTDLNGEVKYDYTHLFNGNYTYVAYHPDDSYYTYINATGNFTLKRDKTNITISVNNASYGEYPVANITSDVAGNYTLIIANKTYDPVLFTQQDVDNHKVKQVAVDELLDAKEGYIASVHFKGNEFYSPETQETLFNIEKAPTNVSIAGDDEIVFVDNATIVVTVEPENATGTVNITVDGQDFGKPTAVIKSVATFVIPDLKTGTHTIIAKYNGDGNYSASSSSPFTVNVMKKDISLAINIKGSTIIFSQNATITVTGFPSDADGKISVNVDAKIFSADVENKQALIEIPNLNVGTYNGLVVKYNATNYNASGKADITVKPANSSVTINPIADVTYGEDVVVTYSVENETSLNITVTASNSSTITSGIDASAKGKVVISGLDAGEYTIAISNAEEGNYLSSDAKATFKVLKAGSTISAENKTFDYPKDVVLVANGENSTGINESSVVVRNLNGIVNAVVKVNGFKMTILGLGAGEYTVSYNNTVSHNWIGTGNATGITILKANSSVSSSDVEVTYGDQIVIVVESDNATEISYQIIGSNGTISKGTITAGENITCLDLATGEYTVNLTTIVNSNYTAANNTSKIIVKPAESSVNASDVNVTYGEPIVIVVDCENATEISYKIIDWEKVVVKEGTINTAENITGLDLSSGTYTVNLTTIVNGNYTAASNTSKITVDPAKSSVSASDVKVTYGEAIIIPVSTVNAIALYYDVVDENGKTVDSDIIQSGLNITVKNLSAGNYDVTLITGVDLNHTSVTNTSRITVDPAKSSVSAEDVTVSYGEPISVAVTSANASKVSYKIIDKNDKIVVNGTVNPDEAISISKLAAGDYTIELTTVTDKNHTNASNSSKLHVKHVITIIIDAISGYTGEVINLTAQFKYENGDSVNDGTASLTIKYDDRQVLAVSMYPLLGADDSYTSEVSDDKATFNIKLGEPGTYPYVVTYSSDDVDAVQEESTITILKLNTTVSGKDISGKPSEEKSITIDVLDQNDNPVANGTVTLTLNGKTYNATVDNGKAAFNVELPNQGTYNATITYNSNEYYGSSESSINANVKKVNTNAPSAEDISGKAGEKTDISIEIADENGNPVENGTATLTIDGKTYTAEVKNGAATFKDVELPEKDTVADVYYQGNDYYNSNSSTFSIKIKQDNNDTEPDSNIDENPTEKHVSSKAVDAGATGNPIAILVLTLFTLVITYRKK